MADRTARISELMKHRAEIDRELAAIKQQMKEEIKSAFAVPKRSRTKKEA